MQLQFPASTGHVAHLFGVSEPRLNDLVRRGKIAPAPQVFSGRRAWKEVHVRQAAVALGIHNIDLLLAGEIMGEGGDDPR